MRGRLALVAGLAALGISAAATALAAEPVVRIRDASVTDDGVLRLVVTATGVPAQEIAVEQDGRRLDAHARPLSGTDVVLAVDSSTGLRGRTLADAAVRFADALPPALRLGIVAFGREARVLVSPTADRAAARAALTSLRAGGDTALYDGVVSAVDAMGGSAQRNVVVLTAGRDTASASSLEDAVAAARSSSTAVSVVSLLTRDLDTAALLTLAERTSGRVLPAADGPGLADALVRVAGELGSQYEVSARAPDLAGERVHVRVTAGTAAADAVVRNPHAAPAAMRPVAARGAMGVAGIALVALALATIGFLVAPLVRRRDLDALLTSYDASARPSSGTSKASALRGRAVGLVDRVPKPAGFDQRVQRRLDRAAWPLRSGEYVALRCAAAIAAGVLVVVLTGAVPAGLVAALAGWAAPAVVLSRTLDARRSAFLAQLPSTLHLLAVSLEAGHALTQALDTIVRESPAPTSAEFSRALTEIRLGMPADVALEAMADRVDSEDFRWVVTAMNVQREVGGSLAELLKTVAATLRERDQVRRQVKVLSAEGRLSALVLGLLPFALGAYMAVSNPTYVGVLTSTSPGRAMLAASLGLMAVGIVWLRKIIRISV